MTVLDRVAPKVDPDLTDAVMAAHFTLVAQPGAIDPIEVEGAEGWTSPNLHPALSLMRWTTNDRALAESAVDALLERFRDAGRGFDWMTGQRCADADLPALLTPRGFVPPALQIAAMVRPIGPEDALKEPALHGFRIVRAEDHADRRIWHIMSRGFDVGDDVGAVFHNAYLNPSHLQRSEVYVAMADGTDEPVAVGYLTYLADHKTAFLRVSSTAEGFRERGLYRALVQRRLQAAAAQGCTRAFVHAYSSSSRHALAQLGFQEVGQLLLHRWRP